MANDTNPRDKSDFEAATGTVSGLDFRGVDLRQSSVPDNATFEKCDFSKADLSELDLSGLEFKECLFQRTDFSNCILVGAIFSDNCNFSAAVLKNVDATGATFTNCNMSQIDASGSILISSVFTGTTTERAVFDRSDLSNATDFAPDRTQVAGTVFAGPKTWTGWKVDGWTYLVAEYTGLKLFLSVLPPLIFVLSLLAKAYTSVAMSAYQAQINLGDLCGENGQFCSEVQLWEIIFGFREGLLASFFVFFSIAYYISRFLLTMRVSDFSSLENRTHVTPKAGGFGGYIFLRKVSTFVWCAKWIMLALFAVNMIELLSQSVVLPE